GGHRAAGLSGRYREAFLRHGIDVLSLDPEKVVRRLQARPQRERLLAALEDWKRRTRVPEEQKRLAQVARKADPDPGSLGNLWGKACKDQNWDQIKELVRVAEGQRLPPAVLLRLFDDLRRVSAGSAEAARLLREGLQRHPRDFW